MWTWLRSFANSDPGQDRQAEPTRTGGGADPPGSTPGSDVIAIAGFIDLDVKGLCLQWRNHLGGIPPPAIGLQAPVQVGAELG